MPKYALPIPLHQIVFKQRIEQYGNASKIIHLNMESRLAGEQVSHILRSDLRHTEQVVCIGTHSKGVELLVRKVAAKRDDRMILAGHFGGNRLRKLHGVIQPFHIYAIPKGESLRYEVLIDEAGTIIKKTFDDMNVHLVAIFAYCAVAVDVSVTVYKVIRKAAIDFAAAHDIP